MPDVTLPVGDLLTHPPIQLMTRELITGVFSGSGDLTRTVGPVTVDAFGLSWDFFTVPAPFGYDLGQPIVYHERMLQLSVVHRALDAHEFISEYHAFYSEGIYFTWETPFPVLVHYEICPGVEVVFHWLLVG